MEKLETPRLAVTACPQFVKITIGDVVRVIFTREEALWIKDAIEFEINNTAVTAGQHSNG